MTDREPLWKVMRDAYNESDNEYGYAAEIRAIADWLAPKETKRLAGTENQRVWIDRQHLRDILLYEADRAEACE